LTYFAHFFSPSKNPSKDHLMADFRFKPMTFVALPVLIAATMFLSACISSSDDDKKTPAPDSRSVLIDSGIVVFESCAGCHGEGGDGKGHGGPVLANSDYVMGGTKRLIATVLAGVNAPITVNGQSYPGGSMQGWAETYSDVAIAGVLTYIRGVLNDSLVTGCTANPTNEFDVTCTKVARTPQSRETDSVSVAEVAAVRDSLELPYPTL
jgi:mono/diheme cytochrome c family protein